MLLASSKRMSSWIIQETSWWTCSGLQSTSEEDVNATKGAAADRPSHQESLGLSVSSGTCIWRHRPRPTVRTEPVSACIEVSSENNKP